jgi:hypothetical protein
MTEEIENLDQETHLDKSSTDVEDIYQSALESFTAQSFSELATPEVDDLAENVGDLTTALKWIISNIKSDISNTPESSKAKIVQAVADFNTIVNDVVNATPSSPENSLLSALKSIIKAKAFKTEGGTKFYASDFAYVPDPSKPSTWKLRISEGSPGNVTKAQLGRAAAAFSSGGFRGNKVQLPSSAVASAKRKIRASYKKLGVSESEIPDSVKENSGMMFFKDNTGSIRWIASYSNNFRDDDNPPEIISEASHLRFVDMVDNKEAPMPELWHWHIPGTRWGVADFVAYDKDNGIAMASGTVDAGHENEAYALSNKESDIRVSHGMPKMLVKYDASDPTIIVEHVTKEISDLPSWAAANSFTGFHITTTEDQEMGLPEAKKTYLKGLGLSDEAIVAIESGNASKASLAAEQGIERKDNGAEAPPPVLDTVTEQVATTTPPPETPPVQDDKSKTDASQFVTKEEMNVFSNEIAKSMADVLTAINGIADKLLSQEGRIKGVEEKSVTIETQAWTPGGFQSALLQKMSAIGSSEANVRKDSGLAKGPEQAEAQKTLAGISTGFGLLDGALTDIVLNGGSRNGK